MILCFRFLLWDVAGPAGHRWRWPVALLYTLASQCVRYHPGAVSTSLGCGGGDSLSLSFIWQSLSPLSVAPACVLCQLFCCQSLFLILLLSTLSPVSTPLLSPLSVSSCGGSGVNPLVCLQSVDCICITRLPGTAFSALYIFLSSA